jgi:hypothetical protein
VILYNGYTWDRRGDFMSLALVNGYLEFRFDLGTGPAIIRFVFIHLAVHLVPSSSSLVFDDKKFSSTFEGL